MNSWRIFHILITFMQKVRRSILFCDASFGAAPLRNSGSELFLVRSESAEFDSTPLRSGCPCFSRDGDRCFGNNNRGTPFFSQPSEGTRCTAVPLDPDEPESSEPRGSCGCFCRRWWVIASYSEMLFPGSSYVSMTSYHIHIHSLYVYIYACILREACSQ